MSKLNDVGLNFAESGTGDISLMFLHYFGGSSNTWRQVIQKLNCDFHCIAVDLWGFGNSPAPSGHISVSENAKSIADLISTLELKKFVLIGHSMGGKIALSLASEKPFGLEKLILITPSPPTPEPMNTEERAQLLAAYNDWAALKKVINNITVKPLTDFVMNSLIEDNLRASQTSWKWWIEDGSQEDISATVSNVTVPVLVISGQCDKKFSSSFLRTEFLKYLPHTTFQEIEATGHLLPVEVSLPVANLIRKEVFHVLESKF